MSINRGAILEKYASILWNILNLHNIKIHNFVEELNMSHVISKFKSYDCVNSQSYSRAQLYIDSIGKLSEKTIENEGFVNVEGCHLDEVMHTNGQIVKNSAFVQHDMDFTVFIGRERIAFYSAQTLGGFFGKNIKQKPASLGFYDYKELTRIQAGISGIILDVKALADVPFSLTIAISAPQIALKKVSSLMGGALIKYFNVYVGSAKAKQAFDTLATFAFERGKEIDIRIDNNGIYLA